jgi:K319L-like, PKD domain
MKRLLTILLLLPFLIRAQTINLRIGQLPYSNPFWNSWKTANGMTKDTSAYLVDVFGNTTKLRIVLSNSGTAGDNTSSTQPYYLPGMGIYPDTVLREFIYNSAPWTATLIGLDSNSVYSVSLFGSRNRTDGQVDAITCDDSLRYFITDTNTRRQAVFTGLKTDSGKLVFSIVNGTTYSYLNAIVISGVPLHSAAHARLWIDSTILNYPHSVIRLSGDSSTGVYANAYSWSVVSGPSTPVFGGRPIGDSIGDTMYVSGLQPGKYTFRLLVQDSAGITDSAFASVMVNAVAPCPVCAVCPPPVTCPTCPTCPVCPPPPAPRTVVDLSFDFFTHTTLITYSDGTTQSLTMP